MPYLISQIALCLALAALLGFLAGWWLRSLSCGAQVSSSTRARDDLGQRLAAVQQERDTFRDQAQHLEYESQDLRAQILHLAGHHGTPTKPPDHTPKLEAADVQHRADALSRSDREPVAKTAAATPLAEGETVSPAVEMAQAQNFDTSPTQLDDYDIEEIAGIGKGYGKRLRALHIATTRNLLAEGLSAEGRRKIADAVGVDDLTVRKWMSMADLMRVPGIMGQFSELLDASGVTSIQDLASQSAHPLAARMKDVNAREHRAKIDPTVDMVREWINAARDLPRIAAS